MGIARPIRLGKATQRTAEGVKTKVEALVVAAITGSPLEDEVARWVANLDTRMADKLAGVGLIPRASGRLCRHFSTPTSKVERMSSRRPN